MNMGIFKKDNDSGFAEISFDKPQQVRSVEPERTDVQHKSVASPHGLTPEEILSEAYSVDVSDNGSALEMLKRRMGESVKSESKPVRHNVQNAESTQVSRSDSAEQTGPSEKEKKSHKTSLLEKLKPYTTDDEGHDLADNEKPLYELQSVADILKANGERVLDSLSKKYDVSFDDLGKGETSVTKPLTEDTPTVKQHPVCETPEGKPAEIRKDDDGVPAIMLDRRKKTEKFVEMVNASLEHSGADEEKPSGKITGLPDISDIDNFVVQKPKSETKQSTDDGTTIMFTPVKDGNENERISISSVTSKIDLGNALEAEEAPKELAADEPELEENGFEAYTPSEEFTDEKSGKRLLRSLAIKKRASFIKTALSFISVLGLCLFLIPSVGDFLIKNPTASMSVCLSLLVLSAAANYDIFAAPAKAFKGKGGSDLPAFTAVVSVILLSVVSVIKSESSYESVLLCSVILFFRALALFWNYSAILGNLKQIANSKPKKAVSLLSDTATTYAMSKNAVDGDVLIAAPRPAYFANGFMKYSTYNEKLSGRMSTVAAVSAAVAVLAGIAVSTKSGMISGFTLTAMILCITAMPSLFAINSLPAFSASKRLNKKKAMIAGISGAESLELANAAVISSADIFPYGTVTLQSMKVLSENSIDDTIMKAASLTEAVGSPLCPIFQKIAGTNSAYSLPDSDTVKYEDRLGLSGWVDNELLFIGNRTLMEAHGIAVPSVEVDRQLLRKGFFPVYLATAGKACALLAVQYDVDPTVAKELKQITRLGVTLLVENSDPNITEDMICDYIGLFGGTIKLMSKSGVHMYKAAVKNEAKKITPAAYRTGNLTFISIMNCASRIKKSNLLLKLCYILSVVFGVMLYIYYSFSGTGDIFGAKDVLLYELAATAVSLLVYLIKKP